MKDEDKFVAHLRQLIRELDPPPDAPRETMWAAIDQERRIIRPAPAHGPRLARWTRWGGALAAMLVLGIGIGRFSGTRVTPVGSTAAEEAADSSLPYQMVAVRHLDAAEELLAALPGGARRGRAEHVSGWAQELLVSTRLLLDSPAADDLQMAALFQDLELVLAQIATLSEPTAAQEIELIQDGIRENDVLRRVRAATNQRPVPGI